MTTMKIAALSALMSVVALGAVDAAAQAKPASTDATAVKPGPLGNGTAQHAANVGQGRPEAITKAVGPDEFTPPEKPAKPAKPEKQTKPEKPSNPSTPSEPN